MKITSVKMIAGCVLLAALSMDAMAQMTPNSNPSYTPSTPTPIQESGTMPDRYDANKVPGQVTDQYRNDYPGVTNNSWYAYPAFSDETDWYGYNPYTAPGDNPEYYVSDFKKDNRSYRVIYDKNGKRIATHRTYMGELPKAVSDAMHKGMYKNWVVTKEKEEMYKDKYTDKTKVYRIVVEKGTEKHALYYQSDGTLVKDKNLKS
jgi:hypothetical protein